MAKLVDAPDLGSGAARCESSSLSFRTIIMKPSLGWVLFSLWLQPYISFIWIYSYPSKSRLTDLNSFGSTYIVDIKNPAEAGFLSLYALHAFQQLTYSWQTTTLAATMLNLVLVSLVPVQC